MNTVFFKKIVIFAVFMGIAVPSNAMMRQMATRVGRATASGLGRMPKLATAAKQTAKSFASMRNPQRALKAAVGVGLVGTTSIALAHNQNSTVELPDSLKQCILTTVSIAKMTPDKINPIQEWLQSNPSPEAQQAAIDFFIKHFTAIDWVGFQALFERNPAAAKQFRELALKNFDKVDTTVICAIIRYDRDTAAQFMPIIMQHIGLRDEYGSSYVEHFLNKIIQYHPTLIDTKKLFPWVRKKIDILDAGTIARIEQSYPHEIQHLAEELTPWALANFAKDDNSNAIICTVMRHSHDATRQFVPIIMKHITTINPDYISSAMQYHPDLIDIHQLIDVVHKNIAAINIHTLHVIDRFYPRNVEQLAQRLTPWILENFTKVEDMVLNLLIKCNKNAFEQFTQAALAHIDEVNASTVSQLLYTNPSLAKEFSKAALAKAKLIKHPEIFEAIQWYDSSLTHDTIVKALDEELFEMLHSDQSSQTLNHVYHNTESVVNLIIRQKSHIPLFKKIIKKELSLKKGFVFYHGQRLSHYFAEYLDTQLLGIQKGITVDDFLLLHTKANPVDEATRALGIKTPGVDPRNYLAVYTRKYLKAYDQEKLHHQQLCHNPKYLGEPSLLFANDSLFGNATNIGSNSVRNYAQNRNVGVFDTNIHNQVDDIFNHRHLEQYKAEFAPTFQKLRKKFEKASLYGIIHMIVIPEEDIDKTVRSAFPGGHHSSLSVNGQLTHDMKKIATALRTKEYVGCRDRKEYVIYQTHAEHGALNPQSGIKVYSFPAECDREALDQIKKEIDAEVAKLRQRVQADRAAALNA